jgi:hypothetical protein
LVFTSVHMPLMCFLSSSWSARMLFWSLLKCMIIKCSVFFHCEFHFWHQFVMYRGFHSWWIFILTPKTQHTTVQYNQQLSEHKSTSIFRNLSHETTLSPTIDCPSNTRLEKKSVINNLVTTEVNYSLVTLLSDNGN